MTFHLLLDPKGRVNFFGDDLLEWSGHNTSQLRGSSITEFLDTGDGATVQRFLDDRSAKLEVRSAILFPDRDEPHYADITLTRTDQQGGMIMVSLTILDQQAQKLKEVNADLFAGQLSGVIHLDASGKVTSINKQLTADTGHTLSTLQQGALTLIPPRYRYKVLKCFAEARTKGQACTFDMEAVTDRIKLLHVNLTIIPVLLNGRAIEYYLMVSNITERVSLQKNLKKLSLVADKITDGVMVLNSTFEIEFINDGFTQISGFTFDDAIGRGLNQVLSLGNEGAERTAEARDNLTNGRSMELEMQCEKKDGAGYWNLLRLTPIMNEQGKMEMCVVIHTDITEKKMAELELRLLADDLYRQNKELHQFAYIVSHNMRSPVANIVGLANLLEIFKDDPETQSQTLAELTKSVNNLDTVIKDLSYILTVNNASKDLLKEPVNFQDMLQQVLIDLQQPILLNDAEITISSKPLIIRTNRAYLHSIFYNLISNGIKYRSRQTPYIKIDHYQTNEHTVIYVADNGKGIDLNKHGHEMFKPYKRFDFKVEGKGLGLFLVKSHIEALGGHLTVKSELQKGSTFYVKIPLL
ncbi:PAS domain-containing protein [Mucilaginibacter daejeonensis]|uniref:PAS domain-containing sensor histidine kinase n=1 Tax=Mucilaginibacter daejeonensis TaxID=398049 RepID=UPI001D178CA9|nr:PAS domain-containing protein [Mucilaginibacter daejeonensis]UEG54679.1 PAS domain-containing protein [Mucilaginibacter daejeonensis]